MFRERIDLGGPDDELKELADTFDDMLGRLEAGAEAQRRFIQDTSHELRNPLAVMATNLDVVLSEPGADVDTYRKTAEVVRRTVDRAAQTVDDLVTNLAGRMLLRMGIENAHYHHWDGEETPGLDPEGDKR